MQYYTYTVNICITTTTVVIVVVVVVVVVIIIIIIIKHVGDLTSIISKVNINAMHSANSKFPELVLCQLCII
jgi:hypothetical protein